MSCNQYFLFFVSSLAIGTRIAVRTIDFHASGTVTGRLDIKFTIGYIYVRSVPGSGVVTDQNIYIFDTDGSVLGITLTNAVFNTVVLDFDAYNQILAATPLVGTNAAYAVDGDYTTAADWIPVESTEYQVRYAWDMGSVKQIQGLCMDSTNQAVEGVIFSALFEYSTDNVSWSTFFEKVLTTTASYVRYSLPPGMSPPGSRLAAPVSARYFRISLKVNTGGAYFKLWEIIVLN